jgi:phosphoribosylformylglycinamidine cyclo-ligase
VQSGSWSEPAIFGLLRRAGGLSDDEMRAAFNLGVGLIAVVGGDTDRGFPVGEVVAGTGRVAWSG